MTRKLLTRIVAVFLAFTLATSLLYVLVTSVTASAVTQSDIDALKQMEAESDKKKQDLQKQIDALETQQTSLLAKKKLLDQQIQLTEDEISSINDQISKYVQMIAQKTVEVQAAQDAQDAQWVKYKANMRTMEENGTISYISIIFQANSFTDLLARIDFVGDIMQSGQRLYLRLDNDKKTTIKAKYALQLAEQDQESLKSDLTQKQGELNTQLDASNQLLIKLESDITTAKALYEQENAAAKQIQDEINKKTEELKKSQGGSVIGTGKLAWPAPSCYLITSPFGMREHPIYHEYWMHWGVDIGVSYGSDIVAADSGTVILSDYEDGGYGNYIVIDHGNGVTTLYAHLSQRLKKEGASVKKGERIALSGSTGASTGPHLHFEVSVNGDRVDPLKYYTGWVRDY